MFKDYYILASGTYKRVLPNNGVAYTLDELRAFVDGPVEVVRLQTNAIMVVNEEGKLRGLPYNDLATNVLYCHFNTTDYIVGNILICSADRIR